MKGIEQLNTEGQLAFYKKSVDFYENEISVLWGIFNDIFIKLADDEKIDIAKCPEYFTQCSSDITSEDDLYKALNNLERRLFMLSDFYIEGSIDDFIDKCIASQRKERIERE